MFTTGSLILSLFFFLKNGLLLGLGVLWSVRDKWRKMASPRGDQSAGLGPAGAKDVFKTMFQRCQRS